MLNVSLQRCVHELPVCHAERSEASKPLANKALEDSHNALPPLCAAEHPLGPGRAALMTSQQFDRREFRFFAFAQNDRVKQGFGEPVR